jgi:hypothetical protein
MKTGARFTYRIDVLDDAGMSIMDHLAGMEDYDLAQQSYLTARKRWPNRSSPCVKVRASLRKVVGRCLSKNRPLRTPPGGLFTSFSGEASPRLSSSGPQPRGRGPCLVGSKIIGEKLEQ